MKFIEILTYILIVIGTCMNIFLGFALKIDFTFIMVKNIILTALLLITGYMASKVLKYINDEKKPKHSKEKSKSSFQYDIPPISDDELKKINEEDNFQEVNLADLYIKNKLNNDKE